MVPTWLSRLVSSGIRQLPLAGTVVICILALTTTARAGAPVPEINPGSMGSAVALLTGGLMLLCNRLRSS
jgi:hypothetical protein